MLIYYIIFGITILLGLFDMLSPIKGKNGKNIFWGTVILIILFKGLRWDTGSDFPQYYACFENVTWSNFWHFERYGPGSDLMEIGYTFINVVTKTLINNYTFFLLWTNAFIMWVFSSTIIKYVPRYKFVALALILVSTNLFPVRQNIAEAIFCLSYRYVIEKNIKKYLICVLIAFSFHRSAIFLAFLYPIFIGKFNFKRNVIIYILIILGANYMYSAFDFLKNSVLNDVMGGILNEYDATNEHMIENETDQNNSIMTYISSLVQLFVFYWGYSKMKNDNRISEPFYRFMLNCYYLNLCCWAISYIPGFGSMNRLPAYFEYGYTFSIIITMLYLKKRKYKIVGLLLFLGTFMIKYNNLPIVNSKSEGYDIYVPYKSFLQSDERMREGIWVY